MDNLSIKERFLSDTPTFFKKLHLFGLALIAIATALADVNGVSPSISVIVGSIGGTLTLISQLAVKDIATLETTQTGPEAWAAMIPQLGDQVNSVVEAIKPAIEEIKDTVKSTPGISYVRDPVTKELKPVFLETPVSKPQPNA